MNIKHFPYHAMGEGGPNLPALFLASLTAKRLNKRGWHFFNFPIYMLTKNWTKYFWQIFWVPPYLTPQRKVWPKNGHPWLPMPLIFCYIIISCYKNYKEYNRSARMLFLAKFISAHPMADRVKEILNLVLPSQCNTNIKFLTEYEYINRKQFYQIWISNIFISRQLTITVGASLGRQLSMLSVTTLFCVFSSTFLL